MGSKNSVGLFIKKEIQYIKYIDCNSCFLMDKLRVGIWTTNFFKMPIELSVFKYKLGVGDLSYWIFNFQVELSCCHYLS